MQRSRKSFSLQSVLTLFAQPVKSAFQPFSSMV